MWSPTWVQGNRDEVRGYLAQRVVVAWTLLACALWMGWIGLSPAPAGEFPRQEQKKGEPQVLRLSLDEAVALFLRQNLDLIMAKYGIESWKGRKITARLFPNPTFSVNTFSAYTQKCNLGKCGAVTPVLSQLFLVAGKRGFRIESAEFGTQSAEATFEDTIRQLSHAVKDAYYRVQKAHGHLAIDRERLDIILDVLDEKGGEFKRAANEQERVRLSLQAVLHETEIIRDLQRVDLAGGDLRVLLGLSPDTEIILTTKPVYQPIDPDLSVLRDRAIKNRPDIRAQRLLHRQRKAELKLAKALQYPDVTVDLGYMIQGRTGPDNQQQWALNFSAPLPVFDRNQGGIVEAGAAVQAAEAEYQKRLVQVQNEVEVAYRHFLHSRKLVERYRQGFLEKARWLFDFVVKGYKRGDAGVLDVTDAGRATNDIEERYHEALYGYYRNLLLLEKAVGEQIAS